MTDTDNPHDLIRRLVREEIEAQRGGQHAPPSGRMVPRPDPARDPYLELDDVMSQASDWIEAQLAKPIADRDVPTQDMLDPAEPTVYAVVRRATKRVQAAAEKHDALALARFVRVLRHATAQEGTEAAAAERSVTLHSVAQRLEREANGHEDIDFNADGTTDACPF